MHELFVPGVGVKQLHDILDEVLVAYRNNTLASKNACGNVISTNFPKSKNFEIPDFDGTRQFRVRLNKIFRKTF